MTNQLEFRIGLVLLLFCAVTGVLAAQAPPGPLPQAESKESPTQSSKPLNSGELERTKDLSGSWAWNADQSDDAHKVLQQARGSSGHGRGRVSGGYPGGNIGWGGRGMHRGGNDEGREKMQELLRPANLIKFTEKEPEIDLTDDQGRKRTYFTDGRKLEKSKDPNTQELAARWDEYRLVTEEKSPRGDKIERSFEVAPAGQQLYETLHLTVGRNKTPVYIRYVYDRSQGARPKTSN